MGINIPIDTDADHEGAPPKEEHEDEKPDDQQPQSAPPVDEEMQHGRDNKDTARQGNPTKRNTETSALTTSAKQRRTLERAGTLWRSRLRLRARARPRALSWNARRRGIRLLWECTNGARSTRVGRTQQSKNTYEQIQTIIGRRG